MRVLHMIPDIGVANGVMSVILNYFRAMPEDIKFDVCYFAEKEKTRRADIEALGGRVFKISAPSAKSLVRRDMSRFFAQHRGEWQALHIHAPHFAVFIAPQAKAAGIKRICCHCHSGCYSLKGNQKRNQLLSLYAKYFVNTRFACSESAGRLWYGGRKFTVLKNAVDCAQYSYNEAVRNAVRSKMGLEASFVAGHIGKTDIPQKNHAFLIEIFAEIKKRRENAVLLLMGAEKTTELDSLCKRLGVCESVSFLGGRTDISELLQACDVFLFPSLSEGLPVSLIEAQAAGLPVIASDCVTGEAVVTSQTKMLSPGDEPELWAERAVEASKTQRYNTYEEMKASGWDISDCAGILKSFYSGERDVV